MLRVLGIDPGTRVCGYGVIAFFGDKARIPMTPMTYVECGVLSASEALPMERRLGELARNLAELLREFAPEVIALEDVFSHINARSAFALAQARGMVLATAGLAGIPVFSYPPAQVKKAVVGSGRAEKTQIARMVAAMLGLKETPPLDASDALAIAITHARTLTVSDSFERTAVIRPRQTTQAKGNT